MNKVVRVWTAAAMVIMAAACSRSMETIEIEEATPTVYGAQAADENLVHGQMNIHLTESLAKVVEANTGEDGMVNVSRVAALSEDKVGIKITGMTRLFPYAGRFEERTRKSGLHLWYKVEFDEAAPLTKTAAGFTKAEGIDIVELEPKICIVGDPEVVEYVKAPSAGVRASSTYPFDDPMLEKQWHYYNDGTTAGSQSGCDINVFPVWRTITTGSPDVIVSVVDGGIDYEHEDLAANIWTNSKGQHGYNFCANGGKGSYAISPHDHGTHVAGTIAAVNNNGIGVCGVAGGNAAEGTPGVKLMSCQIFSSKQGESGGSGATAIKWGADNGAVISQNSWGYTDPAMSEAPQALKAAIDYFIENAGFDENGIQVGPMAGGIVIFASGNEDQDHSSVRYEKSVLVTSVGANYKRAYYSNYGEWANIAATGGDVKKGNQVLSTLPGNKYGKMQGTSMACPHVSGVAALIVSKFGGPGFTPQAVRDRLLNNTTDISSYNRNYYMGKGLVNAYKSIAGTGGKAPDKPTDLEVSVQSNNVSVSVTVPSDTDDGKPSTISVYYDTAPITDISKAMFSSFYVKDLEPGETLHGVVTGLEFQTKYYMVAVAVDLAGNKSAASNQVEFTTGVNSAPVIEALSPVTFKLKPHESARVLMKAYDPDGHYFDFDLKAASAAETLDTLDKSVPKIDIVARLAPTGVYNSKLVITDVYGASASLDFQYEVLANHKPEIVNNIPDIIFGKRNDTMELPESDYFKDEDGEQLTYTIVNTDENVANVNYSKGKFYITALNYGICEVTVTATDVREESVQQSFRMMLRESTSPVDIYPNPVIDYMYVRTDKEATAEIKIVSSLGKVFYDEEVSISPFDPAKVDMTGMPAGGYSVTVTVKDSGATVTKQIVKL